MPHCLSTRYGEEARDNERGALYLFKAQHVIWIPHYCPLPEVRGLLILVSSRSFTPSVDECMTSRSPSLFRLFDARLLQRKTPGNFYRKWALYPEKSPGPPPWSLPWAEFGKVLINTWTYGGVIHPEDQDQFKGWDLAFIGSEIRQGRLKLSAGLYNLGVDTLISATSSSQRRSLLWLHQ